VVVYFDKGELGLAEYHDAAPPIETSPGSPRLREHLT